MIYITHLTMNKQNVKENREKFDLMFVFTFYKWYVQGEIIKI